MKIIFALLLSITSIGALADDTRTGLWLGTFSKKPLEDRYSIWTEVQLRYNLDLGSMGQTLFRLGLLKSFDDKNELGLILGYIQTDLMKEYRPTLQHIFQSKTFNQMSLVYRSRLEYRRIEEQNNDSIRYRIMLRSEVPLNNNFNLVLWEEPFINLTKEDWTGDRTFERNRFFIGGRMPLSKTHMEVGYLNQFVPRSEDIKEHILVVYLFY